MVHAPLEGSAEVPDGPGQRPQFPGTSWQAAAGSDWTAPWHSVRGPSSAAGTSLAISPVPGDRAPGGGHRLLHRSEAISPGRGVRIGLRGAVVALAAVAVLASVGFGIYAYMQVPPLTDLSAQVVSNSQIDLGFPQSGILTKVLVRPGQHVSAGQLMATETVAGLAQQVVADRGAVRDDQAVIRQLNQLLNGANAAVATLSGRAVLTTAPLEVDLANAESQLLRDRSQLATARAVAAEELIRAPVAGTVTSVSGQPGEVVTGAGVAGSGASGGAVTVTPHFELFPSQQSVAGSAAASPVVVLGTGGPVLVNVVVPQNQIRLVHLGDKAIISPTAPGISAVSGIVTQIFSSSIVAAGVVSYEVQVKVVSSLGKHSLLPGMTASATIRR